MDGGVVLVTGITGSGTQEYLDQVVAEAKKAGHGHKVAIHDVGGIMRRLAEDDDPEVKWDHILNADERMLRQLRGRAFEEIVPHFAKELDTLHIIDLHLSFRWYAFLTAGLQPHYLKEMEPYVRCFINIIEDLSKVQERLARTAWGKREILELLVWRDEELLLTDLFADVCGRVSRFAIARGEPPTLFEQLVWHPEIPKVYLSFPITGLQNDPKAKEEIEAFRDRVREFLVVFDPYACRDYEETYKREEMGALRKQVGEATMDRDYRFIDQAEAVVAYFPKKVTSKGVDAEMNHAQRTGKPIFLYSPEDLGGGPFAVPVPPDHVGRTPDEFLTLLRKQLAPRTVSANGGKDAAARR
jgi:adenylate kinase